MRRKKKKSLHFFAMRDEEGEEWFENPPVNFDDIQEMYASGELLDTSELSRYVGWNPRYIYQLIDEYGLPYMKIGRNYYFSKERIKVWIKRRKRR